MKKALCSLGVVSSFRGHCIFFTSFVPVVDTTSPLLLIILYMDLNLWKKLVKCYVWSMAVYGAETWTLRATDQKRLESFEMWCWRRMEKIIGPIM